MKKIVVAILLMLLATEASAVTWRVKKTGSNANNCTAAQTPGTEKLTIAAALACAVAAGGAGNTVSVDDTTPQTYVENITSAQMPSGTSGNQFTLTATQAPTVTIRPSSGKIFNMEGVTTSYYTISNFIIDGINQRVNEWCFSFSGGAQGVVIDNNEIKNCFAHGIYDGGNIGAVYSRNYIHGLRSGDALDHGFYIDAAAANSIIENNRIADIPGACVQIYSGHPVKPAGMVLRKNRCTNWGTDVSRAMAGFIIGSNGAGLGHRVYKNVIFNGDGPGISFYAATNVVVYNNTIYNTTEEGINASNSTGCVAKNNLVISTVGGVSMTGCTGAVSSNNLTTGSAASHFANAAGGDFTLVLGSPAIDGGADVGLPCNAGCSQGAFDPPALIQVDVGTAGANKITLTFDNDAAPPLQASGFAAGWSALKTAVNNPILSAALIGNAVIVMTTQNNFLSTDSCSVSYVQASGDLYDSARIGNLRDQPFLSRSSVPCVNNVTGGGGTTTVLTQLSYRVRELYGSETAAGWKTTAENTPYDFIVSGAGRLRIKSKAETAAPQAFNLGFQKRITLPGGSAGAKTALTDTCSPTDLVCFFGTGTALGVSHNATTTEQLASTLANANCLVLLQNSTPNMQPGINTEWECEIAIKLDPALPKGSKVEIFMTRDGGAEFESYPANSIATLNVIDNSYTDG